MARSRRPARIRQPRVTAPGHARQIRLEVWIPVDGVELGDQALAQVFKSIERALDAPTPVSVRVVDGAAGVSEDRSSVHPEQLDGRGEESVLARVAIGRTRAAACPLTRASDGCR